MRPSQANDQDPDLASDRAGSALSVAAALVWPAQAAVIAAVLAGLLEGHGALPPLLAAGVYLVLAGLRAGVEAMAQRRLHRHAEGIVGDLRREILRTEARAAAPSAIGDGGALAALAAEKLAALRPYLLRYRPARLRIAVLIPVILGLTLWHSWAVALVLILAGPLIPVFMALVGWAAKEASARQMGEIGQLSDLLVDRLVGLAELRLIGAGGAVVAGFQRAADSLRQRTMAVLRIAFLSSAVLELFAALGVAMVAVWVGFALLDVYVAKDGILRHLHLLLLDELQHGQKVHNDLQPRAGAAHDCAEPYPRTRSGSMKQIAHAIDNVDDHRRDDAVYRDGWRFPCEQFLERLQ